MVRFSLELTGYPKLGGGQLHIAHLLWGGLLMLVAMVLLLAVLGKRTKRFAAVIGGIGFGLFVDELGKFITSDNDYFFEPAIALIYVVLIVLFLASRMVERRSLSADELLVNAADQVRELILGGATEAEVARGLGLLERSGAQDALADGLRRSIQAAVCVETSGPPPLLVRAAAGAWRVYDALLGWRWFHRVIMAVFVIEALVGVLVTLAIGLATMMGGFDPHDYLTSWLRTAQLATAVISLLLVIVGVTRLRTSRLRAYRWFERSVLVSVFFTQVFMFWQAQLAALGGLAVDLLLLGGLRYMLRQEDARLILSRISGTRHSAPDL